VDVVSPAQEVGHSRGGKNVFAAGGIACVRLPLCDAKIEI
jgi:hypothetical protein